MLAGALLAGSCAPAPPAPEAVVLVVADTLPAARLGLYGYGRPTSPELEAWADRGAVFDRAFAPSPWTLPSFGTLLTGRFPRGHGAGMGRRGRAPLSFTRLDPRVPVLAEVLAGRGWATGALVTNTFLDPRFGLARGFDLWDQERNRGLGDRRAGALVERALAWIDQRRSGGEPFFLLLHLLDPHLPYDPPQAVQGRFTAGYAGELELPLALGHREIARIRRGERRLDETDRAFITGAYDEQLLDLDAALGRLLAGLDERGLLETALVMLTADHGEELFEHGGFEHGHELWDELLRVPLVVWGPGVRPGRVAEPVSLADLTPTVLDALGASPPEGLDGRSLWPLLTAGEAPPTRPLLAQGMLYGPPDRLAIVSWPWKLIVDPAGGHTRLYDLAADPGERNELAGERPREVKRLAAELSRLLAAAPAATVGVEPDEELLRGLRALGYVE